jgi:hypothetical protein
MPFAMSFAALSKMVVVEELATAAETIDVASGG